MTQEEKWRKNYKEVAEYMDTYHRNPSKPNLGNLVDRRWTVPNEEFHKTPQWSRTPLINAYTGEAGFPDRR